MPKSPETLNRRLLRLREEYGLSQTQWAEALGVEQSQVSRWEKSARGEPEVSSLKNLGGHLGITVAAIIDKLLNQQQRKSVAVRQSLSSPILPVITEEILNQWEVHASSLDLLAIVKLAQPPSPLR